MIGRHGIRPEQLEIEITEGTLDAGVVAQEAPRELRALGVRLALDDFGTGYSPLSNPRLFPITWFKIDKSFIDRVPGGEADIAIVRIILALGNSFKVEVVAEGGETAEQAEFVLGERVHRQFMKLFRCGKARRRNSQLGQPCPRPGDPPCATHSGNARQRSRPFHTLE